MTAHGPARLALALAVLLALAAPVCAKPRFLVGVGKGDITGPVADVNLMGYADPTQFAGGILNRVYARALIVVDPSDASASRWVFVNLDACMGSQAVTGRVVERLNAEFGPMYRRENVVLSGTHTHSGPAGYLQYLVYGILSQGWVQASFDAVVEGTLDAIRAAHADLAPRALAVGRAEVLGANVNRSPTAYLRNPAEERALFEHSVDKVLTALAVFELDDEEAGAEPGSGLGDEGAGAEPGSGLDDEGAGAGSGSGLVSSASSASVSSSALSLPDVLPDPTPRAEGYFPSASELALPGSLRAVFGWFPVHGTSVNESNVLVNGDNKGAAAQLLETQAGKTASSTAHLLASGSTVVAASTPVSASAPVSSSTPASPPLIAALCQENVGDTSPNTRGAFCGLSDRRCDAETSTCDGRVQDCIARGPRWPDDVASCAEVGGRQAAGAARAAWQAKRRLEQGGERGGSNGARARSSSSSSLSSSSSSSSSPKLVDYRHTFVDMRNVTVLPSAHTRGGRTCPPALGFSFAAGTTDGPGAFDFHQSDTNGTTLWRFVRDLLAAPTAEQEACHAPKPILLDVGDMRVPYDWAPTIVELSVLRAGEFLVLGVPGELTTTSGRRLRAAVRDAIEDAQKEFLEIAAAERGRNGGAGGQGKGGADPRRPALSGDEGSPPPQSALSEDEGSPSSPSAPSGNGSIPYAASSLTIVIGGLSNTYSSYITTFEEYQAQRYEGGFTIFGPHTLDAYIQTAKALVRDMVLGLDSPAGPQPPNLVPRQWSLLPPVVADSHPWGGAFGRVIRDVGEQEEARKERTDAGGAAARGADDGGAAAASSGSAQTHHATSAPSSSFFGRLFRSLLSLFSRSPSSSSSSPSSSSAAAALAALRALYPSLPAAYLSSLPTFAPGDRVSAVFQSACPRNDLRRDSTFLTVERRLDDGAGGPGAGAGAGGRKSGAAGSSAGDRESAGTASSSALLGAAGPIAVCDASARLDCPLGVGGVVSGWGGVGGPSASANGSAAEFAAFDPSRATRALVRQHKLAETGAATPDLGSDRGRADRAREGPGAPASALAPARGGASSSPPSPSSSGAYVILYTDDAWCTRFHWWRAVPLSPRSYAEVAWIVPPDAPAGVYRLGHHGNWKHVFGDVRAFAGYSSEFAVVGSGQQREAKEREGGTRSSWWRRLFG